MKREHGEVMSSFAVVSNRNFQLWVASCFSVAILRNWVSQKAPTHIWEGTLGGFYTQLQCKERGEALVTKFKPIFHGRIVRKCCHQTSSTSFALSKISDSITKSFWHRSCARMCLVFLERLSLGSRANVSLQHCPRLGFSVYRNPTFIQDTCIKAGHMKACRSDVI